MSRSTEEWIGRDDDAHPPPRVRLRVWECEGGRCHACTRKISVGETWTLEHRIALINGGENKERNLCLTCCNCLPAKNAADVAEKSKVAALRKKHLGIKHTSRPMAGSRNSPWKRKMDGTIERR